MTANEPTLGGLCRRARPKLECLGDLGRPLLAMLGVVERTGAGRSVDPLGDPLFALDVLDAAGPGAEAAVVGRLLDFLRQRAGVEPTAVNGIVGVTLAVTVAQFTGPPTTSRTRSGSWTTSTPVAHLAEGTSPRNLTVMIVVRPVRSCCDRAGARCSESKPQPDATLRFAPTG